MILHVDMDAFYASVEERDQPELVGKPVIVGGSPERRGVVAAANYIARQFGVHGAMPSVTARRLCPHAVFLPSRIDYYAEVSQQIRGIFERFTPLVEPLSLDEAFLDVTGSEPLFGPAVEIGRKIKEAIRQEVRLVASVGVAPNKFLAKIASDLEKPDGFVMVEPGGGSEFLDPRPVERIWGVGGRAGTSRTPPTGGIFLELLGAHLRASSASGSPPKDRPLRSRSSTGLPGGFLRPSAAGRRRRARQHGRFGWSPPIISADGEPRS